MAHMMVVIAINDKFPLSSGRGLSGGAAYKIVANSYIWHIADCPTENSKSLLPCLYPEYGLPGGIKFPRNGADTDPGVNLCNHSSFLFFIQC